MGLVKLVTRWCEVEKNEKTLKASLPFRTAAAAPGEFINSTTMVSYSVFFASELLRASSLRFNRVLLADAEFIEEKVRSQIG